MKRLFFFILAMIALSAVAQTKIIVQVSNFKNDNGVCLIGLFDNAKAFGGNAEPIRKIMVNPRSGNAFAVFDNVASGTYAVSVIHDANTNNRFDTNFIGIPTEGYGASQNKLPYAAAPKFDANKFMIAPNSTTTVSIKLRYVL